MLCVMAGLSEGSALLAVCRSVKFSLGHAVKKGQSDHILYGLTVLFTVVSLEISEPDQALVQRDWFLQFDINDWFARKPFE